MIVINNYVRSATFNPLTDWTTDPLHGVWASDPLWTPPADGGAVSSWRNGGTGTGDLAQGSGTKQPTYWASTAAFGNRPTVQGDGTDDYLAATFGAAVSSFPYYVVCVFAKGKAANASEAIWDDVSPSGTGYALWTDTGASTWRTAVTVNLTGGTANTNPHMAVVTHNGASSSIAIDGTSVASGSVGVVTDGATGVTLFAARGGATYNSSGHIALWLLFATDPTAQAEWATFKAWVTSFYGITVA